MLTIQKKSPHCRHIIITEGADDTEPKVIAFDEAQVIIIETEVEDSQAYVMQKNQSDESREHRNNKLYHGYSSQSRVITSTNIQLRYSQSNQRFKQIKQLTQKQKPQATRQRQMLLRMNPK